MGSSSSAPPAPDLTNVMANIGRVQETMFGWGNQAWDWIQGQAKAMQPFVTEGQKLAQSVGKEAGDITSSIRSQWDKYAPLRDKNINDAMNFDSPGNIERWQGMNTAQIAQQAQQTGAAARSALIDYGVKPTDARFGLDLPIRLQQMASTAGSNNAIRLGLENEGFKRRSDTLGQGVKEQELGNQTGSLALQGAAMPTSIGTAYTQAMFPWMNPQHAMETSGNMAVNSGRLYNDAYRSAIEGWKAENSAGGSGAGTALGIGSTVLGGMTKSPALAEGGTVPGANQIEGGRRPGENYATHHANVRTEGKMPAQPDSGTVLSDNQIEGGRRPGEDYAAHHANVPSEGEMRGPGTSSSDGHMGWRKHYGGKMGHPEGYAAGGAVARAPMPVMQTQPQQFMQQPMPMDDEAPLEGMNVPPQLRGIPSMMPQRQQPQAHARGDSVGGQMPISEQGGYVDPRMSPSGGRVTDDIPAVIQNTNPQRPAAINAGEFIFTKAAATEIGHDKLRRMMKQAEARAAGTMKPGGTPGSDQRQTASRDRPNMAGRRPANSYAQGGGVPHHILGAAGSVAGNFIPVPVIGPMVGKFAGQTAANLIEGRGENIDDDALGAIGIGGEEDGGGGVLGSVANGVMGGILGGPQRPAPMSDRPVNAMPSPYIDAHDGDYLAARGGSVPGGVLQTGRRARPFAGAIRRAAA